MHAEQSTADPILSISLRVIGENSIKNPPPEKYKLERETRFSRSRSNSTISLSLMSDTPTSNSGSITSGFINRFNNRGVKLMPDRSPSYLVNYDTWSLFSSYAFHPKFWNAQLVFTIKIDSNVIYDS